MKKIFSVLLLTFLFIINVNAEVTASYDDAVKSSQRYIYKFNKYDKYLLTETKYSEIKGTSSIIPFIYKNKKLSTDSTFTRGGMLNEDEFNISKDENGNTYLSQDVEFFLIGKKAVNTLNNEIIDAGSKKYGLRVTEFVIPGTKTKGLGTKNNPWEFVGTYKLTFYIENGKITNVNPGVNKYTIYAVESNDGQIVVNFEPNSGFTYLTNSCGFEHEYDETNKIHRIVKNNKDINNDMDCNITFKTSGVMVSYDLNGGSGNCPSVSLSKGSKISKLCSDVTKEGYTFKGWNDENGNTVTTDTIINNTIKLIAQWEIKKTTLTINPNGGVWNNQTEIKTIEQEYNSTTTVENPSKGPTYKITFDDNNQSATISKNTIEAERSFNGWKLTKESTDTTSKLENGTFTFGSANATLEANYVSKSNNTTLSTISKTGYTCKWNTKSDGSGTSYNSGASNYTTSSNVTLYAICTANLYKVSLDNQGATTAGTTRVNVTYGKNLSNITVPSKSYKVTFVYDSTKTEEKTVSYTFGGYYTQTNGNGTQYINASGTGSKAYNLTSDTTLYAKWTSNSMTLPTSTKTGYTFSGWYTASSGGTKVGNGNASYTPTSNITLYAQWTAVPTYKLTVNPNGGKWNNTTSNSTFTATEGTTKTINNPTAPSGYTVSFDSNGGSSANSITSTRTFSSWIKSGSGTLSGTTFTYGSGDTTLTANYTNSSIILPNTTKSGYTFNGWYTASSGGIRAGGYGSAYKPSSNITLYAHWTEKPTSYTLTIDPNGGKFNGSTDNTTVTGKPGETVSLSNLTVPSGIKATFNANGGSCSTSSLSTSKSLLGWYFRSREYGSISGSTYTFGEGDDTIYPVFNTYSITLPNATRTDYTFDGWYTSSSGGTYVGTSGSSYSPTSNTTLYAHWTSNTYRLNFNANSCGSLGVSYVDVTMGKTYGDADNGDGLPSMAVKTGYIFDGWYTASSGGSKISNSTTVTQSSDSGTLYAHCSSATYYISYNLNDGTHGSSHPTSATYNSNVNISNPTKKVTINLSKGSTASGATLSSTSVSASQTFNGWTASNLSTSTAKYGTSSSSITTSWSSASTKVTGTYFKNLNYNNGSTVTLTANWGQKSITLPTITKSGYTCGFATSASATTKTYESGATYAPNANGSTSINLYGVCEANAPKLTLKLTDSNGKNGSCTSSSGCELSGRFVQPVTITATTSGSPDATMKFHYNSGESLEYGSTYAGNENMNVSGSGTSYKATRTITSSGKRLFKVTATNSAGKSATVVIKASVYNLLTAYVTNVESNNDTHVLHCRTGANTSAPYNVTYKCTKSAKKAYSLSSDIKTNRWYYIEDGSCWAYGHYLTTSLSKVSCNGNNDPSNVSNVEG